MYYSKSNSYEDLEVEASKIYENTDKFQEIINKFKEKLANNDLMKKITLDFKSLLNLLEDYIKGNYNDISKESMIIIISTIIILIDPLDMKPDNKLMVLGDVTLSILLIKTIKVEIDKYKSSQLINKNKLIEI